MTADVMALSVLRGQMPVRSSTAHLARIPMEDGASYVEFHQDGDYFTTHYIPNSKSMLNPPTHLHLYQTEDFKVIEGKGIWYLPTRNQEHTMVAGDPPNHLPAGVFHRFQNPSEDTPLKVSLRIDPDNDKVNRMTEERFFRNFFSYLDDCRKQKCVLPIFVSKRLMVVQHVSQHLSA